MAVAMFALGLAGCGEPGADPASSTAGSADGVVTVLAAASLTDVFEPIVEDFQADHPGVEVRVSFAASSTIVQQVNAGAPADVVALAGTSALEPLEPGLRQGEPTIFASNALELAVPPDNPGGVTGLGDLDRGDLTIVVCAEQVPCGAAAQRLFAEQGLTPGIASYEPDVRATLSKVELGEADVGVVYRTDVTAAGDRVLGIEIPDAVNVVTSYPVLAVSASPLAAELVAEVLSGRAQEHLAAAGFGVP